MNEKRLCINYLGQLRAVNGCLWVPGGGLEPFWRVLLSGSLVPLRETFLFRGSKPPESKTRLNGSKPPLGTQRHQNNAMQI